MDEKAPLKLNTFNGELTEKTLEWLVRNQMKNLGNLLNKGYEGCLRLSNCGEKRSGELKNIVEKYAPEEYDFYMRPVVLTNQEIENIQSEKYLDLKLSHLNLPAEARNFLEREDINTIEEVLELGFFGIKGSNKGRKDTKEKAREQLIK